MANPPYKSTLINQMLHCSQQCLRYIMEEQRRKEEEEAQQKAEERQRKEAQIEGSPAWCVRVRVSGCKGSCKGAQRSSW